MKKEKDIDIAGTDNEEYIDPYRESERVEAERRNSERSTEAHEEPTMVQDRIKKEDDESARPLEMRP